MPYTLSTKPLLDFIKTVEHLAISYQKECSDPKHIGFFWSKGINIERIHDIEFSQRLAGSVKANNMRYASWDSNLREKGAYHDDTILFLKRVIAGSLLLDALEIRNTYWIKYNYKNSSLVTLILAIFEINELDEVPETELYESLQALERYMSIVQQQTPDQAIEWHPTKNQVKLLAAIKKHTPENAEIELTEAGMVVQA